MKFQNIFHKRFPIIGMIHFLPLIGYGNFTQEEILEAALKDLKALEKGRVDAIMVENNYDLPHKIFVDQETVKMMTYLTKQIRLKTSLPLGVSVLWNDYRAALDIAKACEASFIRVPVFVDTVKTNYGKVVGDPQAVVAYRKKIGGENIALFTDIHVKHAKLLSPYSLVESAKKAKSAGSDGIIITGKWTGDAPDTKDLVKARKAIGSFPLLIGSGADEKNITRLLEYANGAIVSTALKQGKQKGQEINVKSYDQRISTKKVKAFTKQVDNKRLIKGKRYNTIQL